MGTMSVNHKLKEKMDNAIAQRGRQLIVFDALKIKLDPIARALWEVWSRREGIIHTYQTSTANHYALLECFEQCNQDIITLLNL